tara:strand:- start:21168 stop:21647 length:480 start_codon:yes stop_codon:yes gene_type:complete
MDGVIANFCDALAKKNGVDDWKKIPNKELALFNLKCTNFSNTIELYTSTQKLVSAVKDIAGDNYGICSSPLTDDQHNSSYWKRVWLERHGLMPSIPNLIFTRNKEKYAVERIDSSPHILVDDKLSNINQWINAGGIGICYRADIDSVDELIKKLTKTYK